MKRSEQLKTEIQQANEKNDGHGISPGEWNLMLLTSIAYSIADIADILAQKASKGDSDANG